MQPYYFATLDLSMILWTKFRLNKIGIQAKLLRSNYLEISQSREVWRQVVQDAVHGTLQHQASDQESGEQNVRKYCSHIHNLEHIFQIERRLSLKYKITETHVQTSIILKIAKSNLFCKNSTSWFFMQLIPHKDV